MDRTLSRPYVATRVRRNWLQLLQVLQRWQRNYRTRQQLAQLDDRQLADIGISHSERVSELDKPFWR
ncbi:hypothetical protein F753_12990 [Stutzerimonas chloritidismutans AW-1]|uniref:YjiS-like domain-containing protein n=1 Tax=Stutzerimonas chloritidismutans AW-1 TaxID=1263865 RepID=V4PS30_STUCH|nr:DUF1127 domain-containing protein [Stutzerimonas chloritidismutans]ESQ98990.1 hypothetical protein F753_12990 [Stutzerimonas chloritidismutans AW-1]